MLAHDCSRLRPKVRYPDIAEIVLETCNVVLLIVSSVDLIILNELIRCITEQLAEI